MNLFLITMAAAAALACCVNGASIYITEKEAAVKIKKFYAFTVYTELERTAGAANDLLDFDLNHRNEDGVFNPATKVFKAPVTGIYFFSYSAVSQNAALKLQLHSSQLGGLSRAEAGGINGQASNMLIAKIDIGDSVFVLIVGNGEVAKACDPACSTFSGYLLHEIVD